LDGLSFTFNGHGEFILANCSLVKLQGRAVPFVKDNITQNATIFSSLAAQQISPTSSKIEFRLNSNKDGLGK
jgi:hypothetical protein